MSEGTRSRSKSKTKTPLSDDDVYAKFIEFLQSPVWCMPVITYLEQRSIVFDKDQGDEKMYRQCHQDYRAMIDMLIECFCADIGVRPSAVSVALRKSSLASKQNQEELHTLLEPVLAAQDLNMFIHLMTRKNIELQLQALQMIEFMSGSMPAMLISMKELRTGSSSDDLPDEELLILRQIMQSSKAEYEKEMDDRKEENDRVEEAMRQSLLERESLQAAAEKERDLSHQVIMAAIADDEEGEEGSSSTAGQPARRGSRPQSGKRAGVRGTSAKRPASGKAKRTATATIRKSPGAQEMTDATNGNEAPIIKIERQSLTERQEYLRTQRDKLLRMKQEARQKAFNEMNKKHKSIRPKTAKAASDAMRGGMTAGGRGEAGGISNDVLMARRALAAKLKAEVIMGANM